MAVVLADVVVVKRCKEERTTCPYISLYTTASCIFPRCMYIHINISSPFSPFLPLISATVPALHIPPNNHPPTKQHILANDKHSLLPTLNIAPPSILTFPLNRTLLVGGIPTSKQQPPPPHFGSLAQIISRNTQTKNKMQGGRAEFKKKPQGYNACLLHAGSPQKEPRNVTQGLQ